MSYVTELTKEQRSRLVEAVREEALKCSINKSESGKANPFWAGICFFLHHRGDIAKAFEKEARDLSEAIREARGDSQYAYLPPALGYEEDCQQVNVYQRVRDIWLAHWVETGEALNAKTFPHNEVKDKQ